MTQALSALRAGEEFQARLFWQKAARLLDPDGTVRRVGFELGPKGFDDIWVDYDPVYGINDHQGQPLHREHIQCKWHVSAGSYGYTQLADPAFINANARSLLERALAAQRSHAPTGEGVRFKLVTNWRIDQADPLQSLINKGSDTLRLNRLFDPTTNKQKMAAVRSLWADHLGIDDEELRRFVRTLALAEATDSLDSLRETLDPLFAFCGLRRIPEHESAFVYDDVVFKWLKQGRLEFDRDTFFEECKREGLVAGSGRDRPIVYGVKSFEHATDKLEERCTKVLDLLPSFIERYIRPEADWETTLYPALRTFLLAAASNADRLRLVIDAHATLAFAAGSVLNIKSGRIVELEQRTTGRKVWAPDDEPHDDSWPTWSFDEKSCNSNGTDIAVAICLTHDIASDVRKYIERTLPHVGVLLIARPSCLPGPRSVACGRHAFELTDALAAEVKAVRGRSQARTTIHLFVAAPNMFTFSLGQRQAAMGRVTLYEYDFDQGREGSYEPSLCLPLVRITSGSESS